MNCELHKFGPKKRASLGPTVIAQHFFCSRKESTLVDKVQESSNKTRAMHVFMTLINWPLCIRIFCLSVLVSWGRKNTYNSVTVSSLLIQLSQKKLKGKITSAIHVFLNQQQQKISDKSCGCGFTTWKKIFCGEQLELKLSLIWFYMGDIKIVAKNSHEIFLQGHISCQSPKRVSMICLHSRVFWRTKNWRK